MCFVLYIAADCPVPSLPYDEGDRNVHTRELNEYDAGITSQFSKKFQKYVGSDQGCGCGFRHVSYQNGQWPEEDLIDVIEDPDERSHKNHQQLRSLLAELLSKTDEVELYGCWDGDFTEITGGHTVIPLEKITENEFHFRERFGYTVTNGVKV